MTENLDAFFGDFAVPVVLGAVTGVGILDVPDQVVGGDIISTETSVTVKTADFPDAKMDDAISVDSLDYTIRSIQKIGDGKLSQIVLSHA